MEIKTISIIGAGAVGAVVGKNLRGYLGKDNVQIIASGERKARYEKDGIFVNGEKCDFNYIEPADAKKSDLIIIATKNLQIKEALSDIKNAVGENTLIMSLLNGIESEKEIEAAYGKEKVIYAFIVGTSAVRENGNINCPDAGTIVFGENDNSKTERTSAILELFEKSGQKSRNPDDIHLEMWKKFLMNVTCNTITSLCRAPYGTFKNQVLCDLVRDCGKEVIAVAHAEGIALTEQMIEDNISIMDTIDPKGKTSMFQDVEAKRKTENKWFCGAIVELGKKHGIETPVCAILERLVEITETAWEI